MVAATTLQQTPPEVQSNPVLGTVMPRTVKCQVLFMYDGVYGYYARRPMLADILRSEHRADGWWLEIKPVELNLPRWIPSNKVLRYVWGE